MKLKIITNKNCEDLKTIYAEGNLIGELCYCEADDPAQDVWVLSPADGSDYIPYYSDYDETIIEIAVDVLKGEI